MAEPMSAERFLDRWQHYRDQPQQVAAVRALHAAIAALEGRADSKFQSGLGLGCRLAIASSVVMSCITACMPARIDRKPASRSMFSAAVRSVAMAPAPLPR